MKEDALRRALDEAINGCQLPSQCRQEIIDKLKGEQPPVKRKLTLSFVLALVIMLLTLSVAVALVQSSIIQELYGSEEKAPQEVIDLIQTPKATASKPLGALSMDEWFYDGRSLHTAFTITNPTGESLLYTMERIAINDIPIAYNQMDIEGPGGSGLVLGGVIDGVAMPTSYSLYNQGDSVVLYDTKGNYMGVFALPEGTGTLTISMAVWRPINTPKLVSYQQYEGVNVEETRDCLMVDGSGLCDLEMFRPSGYPNTSSYNESGAQRFSSVYKALGWAQYIDTITVTTEVNLNSTAISRATPMQMEYSVDGCRIVFTRFELTHGGGVVEGRIDGNQASLSRLLRDGLTLVDKRGKQVLSTGMMWNKESDESATFQLNMAPISGNLPWEVSFAPVIAHNPQWDPADRFYNPALEKPRDVIGSCQFDFTRGIPCIALKIE